MTDAVQTKAGYSILKGQHAYWRMFVGSVVSRFGDSVDALAYAWMVYQLTGSASMSALLIGINTLPSVLVAPLVAPLVDHLNQKAIIISANLGRAGIISLTALLFLLGLIQPWMLMVGTFLSSLLEAFEQPAWSAFYPKIVPEECYTAAKSLSQSASQIAQLVGTAAGAALLGIISVGGVLLIDGLTFVFYSLMVSTIRLKGSTAADAVDEGDQPEQTTGVSVQQYFTDLKEGFTYLKKLPVVLMICVLGSVLNFLLMPIGALSAPYVVLLGQGPQMLGVLDGAMMIGMLAGSALFPYFAPKLKGWAVMAFGTLALGAVYLGMTLATHLSTAWMLYVLLACTSLTMGVAVGLMNVCVGISFMKHVAKEFMARTGSVMGAMMMGLMPLGSMLIAFLIQFVSVPTFLLGFGICIIALGALMTRLKLLRQL